MPQITGYTKSEQDRQLAGKMDMPPAGTHQGYVPTVNSVGEITYAPPTGGDPAKKVAPAFVFTYDDGDDTVYNIGQEIFVNAGVAATAFVNASTIGNVNKMTWAQVEELADTSYSGVGFEIQCHQNTHSYFDLTSRTAEANLATDIETGLATLRSHGIIAHYLAYPGHRLNMRGQTLARKYYRGARCGGDPRINDIHTVDLYRWGTGLAEGAALYKAQSIASSLETRIEQLLNHGSGYIVSCFHSFTPGRYAAHWDAVTLQTAIDMIQAAGIRIISFSQAMHEMQSRGYLTTNAGAIAP